MADLLRNTITANRTGERRSLPSVCSAHPDVLRASLLLAKNLDEPLIVEATSNQVSQEGGYTGMQPEDFVRLVMRIAKDVGFRIDRLIFGGDHLGPRSWRTAPASEAMAKARALVAAYAAAGFTKIHLDCAEGCAGEPERLDDHTAALRAVELAEVARRAAPHPDRLAFMIGTDVPPPGGGRRESTGTLPTDPAAARITLETHVAAFGPLAKRIAGLIVQPGLEFSSWEVDRLPPGGNASLRAVLGGFDGVCFEAHSTDYQPAETFGELSDMGFAVLKVGPALTFAYRQAVYALDLLVDLIDGSGRSVPSVRAAAESVMRAKPVYWQSHYSGSSAEQFLLRHFSYSDRIRYYWPEPQVRAAVGAVLARLNCTTLRPPMLMQVFPPQIVDAAGSLAATGNPAEALILAQVQSVLRPYFVRSR